MTVEHEMRRQELLLRDWMRRNEIRLKMNI